MYVLFIIQPGIMRFILVFKRICRPIEMTLLIIVLMFQGQYRGVAMLDLLQNGYSLKTVHKISNISGFFLYRVRL